MSKTLLALRHVTFEDLGGFEAPLREAGFAIRYCDMGLDTPSGPFDMLAVLGGPIGAYDDGLYPFLKDELNLIAAQLEAGKPVLGICLGAQLMARALGGRVYPGPVREIGWKKLTLSSSGQKILGALEGLPVLHWHGDTFDLPPGATNLASTDACAQQAFSLGRHALAFQFHPEAQQAGFERWLIGHAGEIAATPGVSVPGLRADTAKFAPAAAAAGRRVLTQWLTGLD
jgi:GMP synthase (glutamine-hydrolysing)